MKIELKKAGKRFNFNWIFREIELSFESGHSYGISGLNGSGKSTLLKCLAGLTSLSEGKIEIQDQSGVRAPSPIDISFTAPYIELIEEFDLAAAFHFHQGFDRSALAANAAEIAALCDLPLGRKIAEFSSGMKQRLRIAFALNTKKPVVILDEPYSNLDSSGIKWVNSQLTKIEDRILIIASPQKAELNANQLIDMSELNS